MKFLLPLIFAFQIQAATYYVSTTGNDSTGDGSIGNPWAHPRKAFDNAAPSDTIYARGGRYDESLNNMDMKNYRDLGGAPVLFSSYIGETAIFDGGATNTGSPSIQFVTNAVWQNIILTNWNIGIAIFHACSKVVLSNVTTVFTGQQGQYIYQGSHHCLFTNCTAKETKVGGANGEGFYIGIGGGTGDDTHDIVISRCETFHTGDEMVELKEGTYNCIVEYCNLHNGIEGTPEGAIEVDRASNYPSNPAHIIRGNTIYNLATSFGIHGITGCQIYNNIIYSVSNASAAIKLEEGEADSYLREVYNNTVDAPSGHRIVVTSTQAILTNNIGDVTTGNIALNTADFVDYNNHDYRLVNGGTAVGGAVDLSSIFTVDIMQTTRTVPWDFGAYDFVPSSTLYPNLRINRNINLNIK